MDEEYVQLWLNILNFNWMKTLGCITKVDLIRNYLVAKIKQEISIGK